MLRVISAFYTNLWPRATHLKGLSLHFCKNLKSKQRKNAHHSFLLSVTQISEQMPFQHSVTKDFCIYSSQATFLHPGAHGNSLAGIPSSVWIDQQYLACSSPYAADTLADTPRSEPHACIGKRCSQPSCVCCRAGLILSP